MHAAESLQHALLRSSVSAGQSVSPEVHLDEALPPLGAEQRARRGKGGAQLQRRARHAQPPHPTPDVALPHPCATPTQPYPIDLSQPHEWHSTQAVFLARALLVSAAHYAPRKPHKLKLKHRVEPLHIHQIGMRTVGPGVRGLVSARPLARGLRQRGGVVRKPVQRRHKG